MKIVPQAAPEKKAVNETAATALKNEIKANKDVSTRESNEKMEKTYKLMRKMYGMDEED
jgi:hypothetical protein